MNNKKAIDNLIAELAGTTSLFYNVKTLVADTFRGWSEDYIDDDGSEMTPERAAGYIMAGILRECEYKDGVLVSIYPH